ncbi:MAG: hypothetical protein NVS3B2_04680 [Ramlibacter sp.]
MINDPNHPATAVHGEHPNHPTPAAHGEHPNPSTHPVLREVEHQLHEQTAKVEDALLPSKDIALAEAHKLLAEAAELVERLRLLLAQHS